MMNGNLVEYISVGSGLVIALVGAFTSIRSRKREDKIAEDKAGLEAVQTSKMVQDIAIQTQNTYLQRVQDNVALLEAELVRTKRRLQECLGQKGIEMEGESVGT